MSYPYQFGLGDSSPVLDENVIPHDMDIDKSFVYTKVPTSDGGVISSIFGGDEIKDPITTVIEVEAQDMSTPSSVYDNALFSDLDFLDRKTTSFNNLDSGLLPPLPGNYQAVLNTDPRLAFNFHDHPRSVPDLSQERMHKISGIMRMYYDYHRAYSNPQAAKDEHMERATILVTTLLEHFFPPSQRFIVEQIPTFPTVGKIGWSIPLKGMESFHLIPAEQISCFKVSKNYDMDNVDGTHSEESFPHTYLTILIDDLATLAQWHPDHGSSAINTRGDIMAYSMGVQAKIQSGFGVVFIGPRIEFYKYDNDDNKPMQRIRKDNWAFDMRSESPAMIGQTFEFVAGKTVLYQNGILGGGSQRIVMGPPGLPDGCA